MTTFFILLLLLGGMFLPCWLEMFHTSTLQDANRFPPISEEEFMARCTPGTDPAIALKVRRILADSLNVEYDCIYPESRLADLGAE